MLFMILVYCFDKLDLGQTNFGQEIRMKLGKTGLQVPSMVFGTSSLGNLYEAYSYEQKLELIAAALEHFPDE